MSKRHPGQRRVQHDADRHPDDVFIDKTLAAGQWAKSNQNLLVVGVIFAALTIGGIIYYREYRDNISDRAGQELELAHQMINSGDQEGARATLIDLVERLGNTPHGPEARLLLGGLYLAGGESEQARVVLEPVGASPRDPIEFQAATLLAQAYEEDGAPDEAERLYLRIVNRAELDFQVSTALEAVARLRTDQGDLTGAVELYERILESYEENDPARDVFDMRLHELRTALSR